MAGLRGHPVRGDRWGTAGPAPVDTGSTVRTLPVQDLSTAHEMTAALVTVFWVPLNLTIKRLFHLLLSLETTESKQVLP